MALQDEECVKRKEYYRHLKMDEDVDYYCNWKHFFPGKISKEISRGSYATVFEARTADKINCAIKKPHPHISGHKESMESYQAEIDIHSSLNHPSIVSFYSVYRVENHLPPLLIMERMWKSLHCVIEQKLLGNFLLQLKLQILLDVANGLSYLHSQNIVHRDLTLSNILLTTDFNAKISDFGVAQKLDVTECSSKHCSVPGNPLYMPPETFACNPVCSIKLDIFSFGCNMLCIMNETVPDKQDHFSEVAVAEKFLRAMPEKYFLLKQLADTCLNYEPEKRPNIECILEILYIIAPFTCIASNNGQKVQVCHSSGTKKADRNIALSYIRKWLKKSKEDNSSKAINCYEILVSNNGVMNFFKHSKPESNQQTWLHNLPTKFDHAIIAVYSSYLETLSFQFQMQFLKSFTRPNNWGLNLNTPLNFFPSCFQRTPTLTHATYYVAFSQCSLKKTNKNENIVITLSGKQIITANIATEKKPFKACMAPAEFNVFLLKSSSNQLQLYSDVHPPLGKRQTSEENQVIHGKLEYDQLQFLTIKSLHVKPVLCNRPQVTFEELLLEESFIKKSGNSISYGKVTYAQKWLSSSVSEHLSTIKPNSIARVLILASYSTCALGILVVTIKTTLTLIRSKVLASLSIGFLGIFGFHALIVLQSYKLCCYQHNLLISNTWLIIIAYQIIKKHGNMVLCINAFYGNCFSVNSMQKKLWSAVYTCCTLYDRTSNLNQVCKFGFVKSLAIIHANKNDTQQKLMMSEAYCMSKLMLAACASLLAWFIALHNKFNSSLLDNRSCYSGIDSENFSSEVMDSINCSAEVTTSLTLFANGDDELKMSFYVMRRQPSTSRRYIYTEKPLHVQPEIVLGHPLSEALSNGVVENNMFNISYFSLKQQQRKSVYACTKAKQHNSKIECLGSYTKPVASLYSESLQFSSPVVGLHVAIYYYKAPQISSVIISQGSIVAIDVQSCNNKQILPFHQSEQFDMKALVHVACKQSETHRFSNSRLFKAPVNTSSSNLKVDPAQSYYHHHMHMPTSYVCLTRCKENVSNWYGFLLCIYNNTQPMLTLQAIGKHINYRLCISLCNDQAIINALCKRLQHLFTNYCTDQKKINFILIQVQMCAYSYALKPNVLERTCEVTVPCRNMLKLASCTFPCQHVRILCKQFSVSLVSNTTSHQCLAVQTFSNNWKKEVEIIKNCKNLPVSLILANKENFANTQKVVKINAEADVVPNKQIKNDILQLEHLPNVATDLASGKCDEITSTIEWLFLQSICNARVHVFHKRFTEFTLTLLLLENKCSSKPRSSVALSKPCPYKISLAKNYLSQEFPRVIPIQALHKNACYTRNKSSEQVHAYGNTNVLIKVYCFESRHKHLYMQYQQSIWYNMSSCRVKVLSLIHVIKCEYKLCYILYNHQIYASFTVKMFQIMQNKRYTLSYQEFSVGSVYKYVFGALKGFPGVHDGLQINAQKNDRFIANGVVLEILHLRSVYLFNSVSQLKVNNWVNCCAKSEVLYASLSVDQVFASFKSSTLRNDRMPSLNRAIDMEQQSQTAVTFKNALSICTPCTTEHLISSHQGKRIFSSAAVITITYYKLPQVLSDNLGRKCTPCFMKIVSAVGCRPYHDRMSAIIESTTSKSLKEELLVPPSHNCESRNGLIVSGSNSNSSKMLHSLPQDICAPGDTSINSQGLEGSRYSGVLIEETVFNETWQRRNKHKTHNVVTALTEEDQDQSYSTSNKHSSTNSTNDNLRKGKECNNREFEGCKKSNKQRDSHDNNDEVDNNDHDDGGGGGSSGNNKRNGFISALFYISSLLGRLLVLLFLLHYIWLCLPSYFLSQLTTSCNDVNISSCLPNISYQSTCRLIKAEQIGKKSHCNILRLPFKHPFMEANVSTAMQTFIQNNIHFNKDKQINIGNGKPVTSLTPLCYKAALPFMLLINYKSYLLQVWNLGIECFQRNVSAIYEETQLEPITLKAPRTQRMIPELQQLYVHFTSLKKGRKKFNSNATRSKPKYKISMLYASLLLDHEGDKMNVCDVVCCIAKFCKAMHGLLKQIYLWCHIQHSLCDGAFNTVVLRYNSSERYDTFAQSSTRTMQTKYSTLFTMHIGHTNGSQASISQNTVKSSNSKCNINKLDYNKNFNTLMENGSHHSIEGNSKDKPAESINSYDEDSNSLYFLLLSQLLLLLLLFDIIIILILPWLAFGHVTHGDVTHGDVTHGDVTHIYRKRLIKIMPTSREMYQFSTSFKWRHQVIVDTFKDELCKNTRVLCITTHCKVLTCLNCVPLQVWKCIISYQTTASFSISKSTLGISEKLYFKAVSKQRLILIQNRLDTILFFHRNPKWKLTIHVLINLQSEFSISKFHIMNKTIYNLVDTNALNIFLLPRMQRCQTESIFKHNFVSEMHECFMQWMSNFSFHRFVDRSFGNYSYFRRYLDNKATLEYVIPSRDTLEPENEEIISCCYQDSILGSQSTALDFACTIQIVATKRNRIDTFRPINIASGRTINYYPYHLYAEDDDRWELVTGHIPVYVTSVIQELPNEQHFHHEIIYANKTMYQFGLTENFDAFVPPDEHDLGNNFNDSTVIVSYEYIIATL